MADVQLAHRRQAGDRLHVVEVQGVPGVEAHPQADDCAAGGGNLVDLGEYRRAAGVAAGGVKSMRVGAGVDFADTNANARRRLDLREFGVDERAHHDAGIAETLYNAPEPRFLRRHVETAFGSDFVSALRNQHCHLRAQGAGDVHHLGRCRHLEVELHLGQVAQFAHVLIVDVPTILAQMDGNAIRTAQVRLDSSPYRVGLEGEACLA